MVVRMPNRWPKEHHSTASSRTQHTDGRGVAISIFRALLLAVSLAALSAACSPTLDRGSKISGSSWRLHDSDPSRPAVSLSATANFGGKSSLAEFYVTWESSHRCDPVISVLVLNGNQILGSVTRSARSGKRLLVSFDGRVFSGDTAVNTYQGGREYAFAADGLAMAALRKDPSTITALVSEMRVEWTQAFGYRKAERFAKRLCE